jgi:flavin reductase (DIM6/NTAB) family NADH-FMN oxidoreductase RutF
MKIDPSSLDPREVHELLVSCILPRPIILVSSIGKDGVYNAAPFSFCTVLSLNPALIGFAVGRKRSGIKKDTLVNIEFSGEFVVNVVPESLAGAMNQTGGGYPSDVDEFAEAGLTPVESDLIRPPRVA